MSNLYESMTVINVVISHKEYCIIVHYCCTLKYLYFRKTEFNKLDLNRFSNTFMTLCLKLMFIIPVNILRNKNITCCKKYNN